MSEEQDADTRARILDAAERAFAEGGLAGARVAAIAEEAGANKAMVYYYFQNKEGLYNAVLGRVLELVVDVAGQVSRQGATPAITLVDFAEAYGRVIAEHPQVVRMIMRGLLDSPDEVFAVVAPRIGQILPLLASRVAQGQSEGTVNPNVVPALVPPAVIAPMVFITVAAPLLSRLTGLPVPTIHTMWTANLRELSLNGLAVAVPEESP